MVSLRTKARARGAGPHAPPGAVRGAGASPAHAEELSDLDEEGLAALLALRPDLADPVPASAEEVEHRAFSAPSVLRALREADTAVLQLVQIFTILGEKHARLADVAAMAGDGTEAALDRALSWLARRHLVARVSDDEVCVHPMFLCVAGAGDLGPPAAELVERLSVADLQSVLGAIGRKAGVGRKATAVGQVLSFLADGHAVRDLVARAPAEAGALARRLAIRSGSVPLPWDLASDPYRQPAGSKTVAAAVVWLLQHGLVYKDSWMAAQMPREVGLALRGGHPFPAGSYRRPDLELAPLAEPSPSAFAARAVAVSQAVERMVECWGSRPAPVLKSGGVGVREVRRLAADAEVAERDAFRLVEVAAAAGLVVADARRGSVLPTPAADRWLDLSVADRWWVLARSWLEMAAPASLAGAVDGRGKPVPALEHVPASTSAAPAQRRSLLRRVVETRNASLDADVSLAEAASWDAPLAWSDLVASADLTARWALSEMELLGMAVEGVPTALAGALLDGDADGARRLLADPAADAWEVVLQADLTALATGRVPSQVRAELTLLADVEGRGSATVYRFSEGSVRRAFDAGRTAEEILGFLDAHAAKGVPQALAYLVGDVERRHGHMRVGRGACFVRFDDAALATEVLRAKKTAKLGLRQIAPTVLVSDSPLHTVLSTLRASGYLPVEESVDGTTVHTPVVRERAWPGRARELPRAVGRDPAGYDDADPWGLGSLDAAAGVVGVRRALAAALLRSSAGGPRETDRRPPEPPLPGARPRVEIPTMLRRPASAEREPAGLLDALGLDGPDLDRLLELGAEGFDVLDDEDFDDEDLDDEDFDDARERSDRPTEIVRSREAVLHLLELAEEEEWLVRISYTSGAGKTFEVTVDILDVSGTSTLARAAPRWTEQKYVVERIGWARVLTEAEEELVR